MVREARYIREVSPFLQGFYVDILRSIYSKREKGDIEGYKLSLEFLFFSCPSQVKKKVLDSITKYLREQGILSSEDKIEDISDVLNIVDKVCSKTMEVYGVSLKEKRRICVEEGMTLLDIVYEIIVGEMHDNEIFIVHKQLLVGSHEGEA